MISVNIYWVHLTTSIKLSTRNQLAIFCRLFLRHMCPFPTSSEVKDVTEQFLHCHYYLPCPGRQEQGLLPPSCPTEQPPAWGQECQARADRTQLASVPCVGIRPRLAMCVLSMAGWEGRVWLPLGQQHCMSALRAGKGPSCRDPASVLLWNLRALIKHILREQKFPRIPFFCAHCKKKWVGIGITPFQSCHDSWFQFCICVFCNTFKILTSLLYGGTAECRSLAIVSKAAEGQTNTHCLCIWIQVIQGMCLHQERQIKIISFHLPTAFYPHVAIASMW